MPAVARRNIGRRSVTRPTAGWRIDAVTWKAKCRKPIWVKVSA